MPRAKRICPAGKVYHLLKRAVARMTIFEQPEDCDAFLRTMPFRGKRWATSNAIRLGLESTRRPRGQPRKQHKETCPFAPPVRFLAPANETRTHGACP
ncbi:MAG: hypothetical protein WD030_08680 [Pirellulales bacterium]